MSKNKIWLLGLLLFSTLPCFGYTNNNHYYFPQTPNLIEERYLKEDHIPLNYIGIAFHKPNFVLPFYYTGSPYNSVYNNYAPKNKRIKNSEVKYQLSLKVPLWKDIWGYDTSLFFAFSLLSYWQVYNHESFMRENDYEPDFFFRTKLDCMLFRFWSINYLNFGFVHQSNGFGNSLQRSWDRLYLQTLTSSDNWLFSVKPWVIIYKNKNNKNIGSYLGYVNLLLSYKIQQHVFSFEIPNFLASLNRTSVNLTWSFPITPYIKGYAELFSGYGQSLIEYNHRTNSFGLGFALNDWI